MDSGPDKPFVSRAGLKLDAALNAFGLTPAGWNCADLGSHVGGFVDCLLAGGAQRVYSIDTAYGTLAWSLRRDPRVVVMERTNALHAVLPEAVDLVTIDVGWTPQRLILPAAARMLKPGGRIVSLLKPHYEAPRERLRRGVLPPEDLPQVAQGVLDDLTNLGIELLGRIDSPLRGHGGNVEVLLHLRPIRPVISLWRRRGP